MCRHLNEIKFCFLFFSVSHYTNVVQYAMMCGVISSPLAGIVYDINKHIFFGEHSVSLFA